MLSVQYDATHHVALMSFSGEFGRPVIGTLDRFAQSLVAARGPSHFLFDFSGIERVNMPDQAVAARGRRRQLCPGYKRVIVAPQAELFGLFSLFGAAQTKIGARPPLLARSLDVGLMQFGLGKLNFRPIEAP